MILPDKNTTLSTSLLGVGAMILKDLQSPHTVSSLWDKASKQTKLITFEKFCLVLDFLYSVNLIRYSDGIISLIPNI